MHDKHSHIWPSLLLHGFMLFLIVACSSRNTPARTLHTITPALYAASPIPRASSTTFLSYTGHMQAVLILARSSNGRYVASCSNDTTVHVLAAETGKRMLIYHGHKTGATAISWSPNGKRISTEVVLICKAQAGRQQ